MTANPETVTAETLGQYSFFAEMSQKVLQKLAGITRVIPLKAGDAIFTTGDTAHSVFVLQSGKANILIEAGPAGNINVSTINPGEAFGWSAITEPHYFTATARVTEAGAVFSISAPQLRKLMAEDSELATTVLTRIAQVLAIRLRDTRYQLIGLLHH